MVIIVAEFIYLYYCNDASSQYKLILDKVQLILGIITIISFLWILIFGLKTLNNKRDQIYSLRKFNVWDYQAKSNNILIFVYSLYIIICFIMVDAYFEYLYIENKKTMIIFFIMWIIYSILYFFICF